MIQKKSAHYQRRYRQRLRDMGLVKKEIWILPERSSELNYIERELRRPVFRLETGDLRGVKAAHSGFSGQSPGIFGVSASEAIEKGSFMRPQLWTTQSLCQALAECELFAEHGASLELVDAAEACILITMHEYGDLPLFMTVSRQHILVEALLWPTSVVRDPDAFNREILRTHKFFSLSTIGLDIQPGGGEESYIMFGSLSAASILPNILFEIETLADNVIRATEAYEDFIGEAYEA